MSEQVTPPPAPSKGKNHGILIATVLTVLLGLGVYIKAHELFVKYTGPSPGDTRGRIVSPSRETTSVTRQSHSDSPSLAEALENYPPSKSELRMFEGHIGGGMALELRDIELIERDDYGRPPEAGTAFLGVELELSNYFVDGQVYCSPLDLVLEDDQNYTYEKAYSVTKKPELVAKRIGPGESVRGWIVYEVQSDTKRLYLTYTYGHFGSGKIHVLAYDHSEFQAAIDVLNKARAESQLPPDILVYAIEGDNRYHHDSCRLVRYATKPVTYGYFHDAIDAGYAPCSTCEDAIKDAQAVPR